MITKHCELLKNFKISPKTILEIGSRDALDSNFYQKTFNIDDCDVYVVEPNPIMFEQIKINFPNYNIFNFAISNAEGKFEFNQVLSGGSDPIGVSSLLDRTDDFYEKYETKKIVVDTISGNNLLKLIKKDIDICKIDVEGLTYEVLISFQDSIKKIKSFHLETEHFAYWKNQKLHNEVCNLMENLGYIMIFEKSNSSQADTIWISKD